MTDATPPAAAPATGLVRVGEVAARNIALALNLGEEHVAKIEQAISDEINTMSAHFTMAVADVQTHYEADVLKLKTQYAKDVAEIKAAWNWLKANRVIVSAVGGLLLVVGALVGHLV